MVIIFECMFSQIMKSNRLIGKKKNNTTQVIDDDIHVSNNIGHYVVL